MNKTGPIKHARRALLWLGVMILALSAVLISGVATQQSTFAPKLALDLEGGTQMILSPKVQGDQEINQEQLEQAVKIIRQRVDGSGVSEAEITTQSGRNVVVSMPGSPDEKTRELIQASANMEFRPVIAAGTWEATPKAERTKKADLPKPTAKPKNGSDENWIDGKLLKKFEAYDCADESAKSNIENGDPDVPMISCDPNQQAKYILGPVAIPGTDIADATSGMSTSDQGFNTGKWVVNLEFNSEGAKKFGEVTKRLVSMQGPQHQFAVVLDGKVLTAPTANAQIGNGKAEISGNFTEESAKALAEKLKYGALPISFEIQSDQQISATLGSDQLRMGMIAGIIGLALVAVYSFFQYRLLGLVTIVSLLVAGVLTYLAIVLLGWAQNYRLSLAGIAGIIVAIGLTADSFIVYFERVRDELRDGRSLPSAVETGWKRAKQTVIASKAVNLLAAVVLYVVAVGNVKGFAFTLGLTAIADLIVVFLFTHPMLQILAQTRFFGEGHRLSGLDPSLLGAEPLYKGAGRIRDFRPTVDTSKRHSGASKEAARRQTIAERKQAERGSAESQSVATKEDDNA
ncbi:MAG: protein translocase subunit SecD [Arthrobacter sp.]|uniref:protein translocase subunit SecD n=1 Tax=unclassified Arthrobacter TaxID=235627 RepID=UPI0026521E57|nr:protein translocase subunit SecD [Micrococcaceae bacterium]MDN5880409.1 protein translocase subunit SecD [Micrococcaceae bacterium]MDN5887809.1 protein translocase subunit SecD [Micrococcaceae bacterium]MDN5906151.1 protein translocase subunit SecD [Micrococcaceae bacterium]MDN6177313.1 protein translocase subunit SecD [Micrococcaceae bacterium]